MMETRDKIKNSQFKKETDLKETKAFDEQPAVNLEKTKKILEPF